MLHVSDISKSYGAETILADISFVVNAGERVGLVGPNGCGKTTLLRVIMELEETDRGQVRFDPPNLSVGYLPQSLIFEAKATVDDLLAEARADHSRAWLETWLQQYDGAVLLTSHDRTFLERVTGRTLIIEPDHTLRDLVHSYGGCPQQLG